MSYESHIGKQLAFEGCIFTIKSMRMKSYRCCKNCVDAKLEYEDECGFCPTPIVNGMFSAFELVLNVIVTNKADEDGWFVGNDFVKLVDDTGFAHPGYVLCDKIHCIQRAYYCNRIKRRTQADMVYIFPHLNEKSFIQALMLDIGSTSARLDLEKIRTGNDPFSDEVYEKVSARPGTPLPDNDGGHFIGQIENEEQAEMLLAKAHALQKLIERLAKKMQEYKHPAVIDAIRVLRMEIRERIETFEDEKETKYRNASGALLEAVEEFQSVIDDFKEQKFIRNSFQKKQQAQEPQTTTRPRPTSETPFSKEPDAGFQERCTRILQTLGYADITTIESLSPDSIRLSASRYGVESIVFCRNDAPVIDTGDIQNLADAMVQTRTSRGVYLTTGRFTRGAEFKAMSESIDLIDIDRIKSLGV